MKNRMIYVYIFNTMADWEPAYILAELSSKRYFRKDAPNLTVRTCALTRDAIQTMGGLTVVPDLTVDEIEPQNGALLLLPGGDKWLDPSQAKIIGKAKEFLQAGVAVAAICGATEALAEAGMLDDRPHTSNDLRYLQYICKSYKGGDHYQDQPVVTDGDLITATGLAPLEFAQHILKKLDVFLPETLDIWYRLNKTQDPQLFFALMKTLG